MSELPASQRAEEFVLSAMLRDPAVVQEVVGAMLEPEHFYFRPYRTVFEEIVERHFADEPIEPLLVAEAIGKKVAKQWGNIPEREAIDKILALAQVSRADTQSHLEHAALIRKHSDYRALLRLAERLQKAVQEEGDDPEQIAAATSADAMRIATATLAGHQTLTYGELGKRFVARTKEEMALYQAGVEIGARYGIRAIDQFTDGHRPGEVMILGGPAGAGKSAIAWAMGRNFALKQHEKPAADRVGVLICSMEMAEPQSSARFGQAVGRIEGQKLRLGSLTPAELQAMAMSWAKERDLPLYVNHSGRLRQSQLRAIVVEAIRKWNVGVVVLDHFKFIKPDRPLPPNEADDDNVEFLTMLAKDLNTAVVCLAHTVKTVNSVDKRPRMEDLRGSGMISAFVDFVGLLFRPFEHATAKQRDQGQVGREDAEIIWVKSRFAGQGTGELYLDLSTMRVT